MDFKINKKSQVTIFVIIGIVIAVAILLIFLYRKPVINTGRLDLDNPQSYIDSCIQDSVKKAVEVMLPQGGYIDPENYLIYNNHKIAYLCFNINNYKTCVNQEPLYLKKLESEIKDYATPLIDNCFDSLKKEYESENYNVDISGGNIAIDLKPQQIRVEVDKRVDINKNEQSKSFETFKSIVNSPLYDLGIVAQEIVSQEAKYCYFDVNGYSYTYPKFFIRKLNIGSRDTVYTIEDKFTGKTMEIAIRSCAIPEGPL